MKNLSALPRGVWALGIVSLLMDTSSEIVHGLLPVFLVSTLGASMTSVGLLEGVAEATALLLKVFSGPLSDWWGRRKPLVVLGYAMGALSKPFFAIANTTTVVFAARVFDRMGKGIRGAPRDALVADLAPPELRGRAFGLRQSLDNVGAFAGPALAVALMAWTGNDTRKVFWIATIPGILAVAVLCFGVRENRGTDTTALRRIHWADLAGFSRTFWGVVAAGALFQLARFSEAFLVLRARDLGLALVWTPLVLVAMNLVASLSAYPLGIWSDRVPRSRFLLGGTLALAAADFALARANTLVGAFVGIGLWGLHLGLTQGILAAMVADHCDAKFRGTAFGVFNLFSAVALLAASVVAGVLWDRSGAATTFTIGAAVALASFVALAIAGRQRR